MFESIFADFSAWGFIVNLWPLLLVLFGLYIIINRGQFGGRAASERNFVKFIGSLKTDLSDEEIGDIDLSIFIGELRVDLTRSRFKQGENNLHVSMGIGETIVLVPSDIPVRLSSHLFAGELYFDDKRSAGIFPRLEHSDDGYESAERRLHVLLAGFVGEMTIRKN